MLFADVALLTWQSPSDLDWEIDAEELDFGKGHLIGKVRRKNGKAIIKNGINNYDIICIIYNISSHHHYCYH